MLEAVTGVEDSPKVSLVIIRRCVWLHGHTTGVMVIGQTGLERVQDVV